MRDLRLAIRALSATPIVSIVAVLSLALGIGANTALFSLTNSLLLRSLPVSRPDRLVILADTARDSPSWSNPVWEQLRSRTGLAAGAFAWSTVQFNLARAGDAQLVEGIWASGEFFEVLGVPPALGRTFTVADDRRGGGPDGPVAVISDDFWRRHFGGSPDAVGQSLVLGTASFTVIGITPPGFFGPDVGRRFDVIVPIGTEPLLRGADNGLDLRGRSWLRIMMRLKPNQSRETAIAGLRGVQPQVRDATLPEGPQTRLAEYLREPFDLTPASTGRSPLRDRYGRSLLMLMAVVGGVLLIACANIANLLLARADARRLEMSLRVALGASRARVVRLLLAEAVCLSVVGALIGFGLARWMSALLVQQLSTRDNLVFLDLTPDLRVLGFVTAITVMTAVVFGTVPAWQSARSDPGDVLKEQGRGPAGSGRSPMAATLVVVQVALSLVLVVAAGLFVRTFAGLAFRQVGFAKERVLVVNVTAPMTHYSLTQLTGVYERIREAVATLPGVERAALSDITPVGGSARVARVEVSGGVPRSEQDRMTSVNVISSGWLATYRMRLLAGRDISPADGPSAPPVALVNEAFVRQFLPGVNPIGHTIDTGVPRSARPEIVGLVEDAVYRSLREEVPPTMYTPTSQRSAARPYVNVSVLAAQGPPAMLSPSVSAAISDIGPDLVLQSRTLTEQVNADMSQERLVALLFGFFGVLALAMAALGLYGVTAYAVSRRRAEIGIRMALGAAPVSVIRLVMSRVAGMVAAGIAAGTILSVWAARFVETLVWGLEPRDPATFIGAAFILAGVGALAGWLPAWRASRIDPAIVLRE